MATGQLATTSRVVSNSTRNRGLYSSRASSPTSVISERLSAMRYRSTAAWRTKALEIDVTDPDFLSGVAVAAFGLAVGIGIPVFLVSRDRLDEERVEALREFNKDTYEATGEYLSKEELAQMRTPRWTDKREFQDDD